MTRSRSYGAAKRTVAVQHQLPLFAHHPCDEKMRRVAYCGVVKRKRPVLAVARRIRRELGLPPLDALNSQRPIAWLVK